MNTTLLTELLNAHPNLYFAFKQLNTASNCQLAANRPLYDSDNDGVDDKIHEDWKNFMTQYPERMLLGADEFVYGSDEISVGSPSSIGTWKILAFLDNATAFKIACENPRRIYNLP